MTVTAKDFGKVAVLMGGWAAEREVSLVSGQAVLEGLRHKGVDAWPIDAGADVIQQLEQGQFDRAFIVLHGRGGEDGVIQGALEILHMPYTGSGVLGSALGMDKYRCKLLWAGQGLPTPEYVVVVDRAELAKADKLGYPLFVKPAHEGSSIGVTRVDRAEDLASAWEKAKAYDDMVLVERCIQGGEYTVAILGDRALPAIKLETDHVFYDYDAKYKADDTRYLIPCGLPQHKELAMQQIALQAFHGVGAEGWGRVDFMVDGELNPWLIEVNTVPGMTSHSLVPMAARSVGIEFPDLVWKILEQTL